MDDRKKRIFVFVGIFIMPALLLAGIINWDYGTVERHTAQLNVPKDRLFTAISFTITRLDEMKNYLGTAANHEFTIRQNNHEYTLLSCSLDRGEKAGYCFLFEDNQLKKITYPYYYENNVYNDLQEQTSQLKSCRVDNDPRIRLAMDAKPLTRRTITEEVNEPKVKYSSNFDGATPKVLFKSFELMILPRVARAMRKNAELRKEYNGFRIHLGMSPAQVDAVYGEPLQTVQTTCGDNIRIYGKLDSLDLAEFCRYSWVAVVFRDQKAIGVLSNMFFNSKWEESIRKLRAG